MMSAIGYHQERLQAIASQNTSVFNELTSKMSTRKISRETIHSGHFMVSEIDESEEVNSETQSQTNHESDYESPSTQTNPAIEYDLESACKETSQTYVYGPRSTNLVLIDGSLTKLFECMSLAYSGKITSPRWKTFKGLKLKLKDKIRLNNIIWRCWHIQFITGHKTMVCQFSSPIDNDTHKKPEAIVLEGKYWKRKLATVTAEYKKWRMYYSNKKGRPQTPTRPTSFDWENRWPIWATASTNMPSANSDDDFAMDFTDNLFNSLLTPNFDFPNPREIARSGMGAEFIQPGLVQLQPTLDDFMDTFEPLQEYLNSTRNLAQLPVLSEETTDNNSTTMMTEDSNQNIKICDSIRDQTNIETDFLNSLLCQTNSNQLSKTNYNPLKSNTCQMRNNNSQLTGEISISQTKLDPTKMNREVFPQFASIHVQEEVPLQPQQNDSTLYSIVNAADSFTQFDLSAKNNEMKLSNNSYQSDNKFAVPKYVPSKQRSRSRSISSPANNNIIMTNKASPIVMQPQAALSMVNINSTRSTPMQIERSTSLPVYTREKRNVNESRSSEIINSSGQAIYVYSPQIQMSQETSKIQTTNHQLNEASNSSNLFQTQQILLANNTNDLCNFIPHNSSAIISRLLSSSPVNSNIRPSNTYPMNIRSTQQMPSHTGMPSEIRTSQSAKNATIDASCIGIPVTTVNDAKQSFMLPQIAFKEGLNYHQSLNQNFSLHSSAEIQNQISKISSLVSPQTSKDVLISIPSASSPSSTNSSPKGNKIKSSEDRNQYKEHRRVSHINAEQKRRCNIKNGFDTLRSLLPSVSQNSSTKISKAAMLQKAADYIRTLKNERQQQQEEYDLLKQQIENLNQTIGVFQNQLPATGVPVSCQRTSQTKELYENYVKLRTLQNWKFWIFSIIMESLLESYNSTVATSDVDEMCKTLYRWLDQNCCLVTLRRDVLNSLRYLSTSTNILTNPSTLPDEAVLAVTKKEKMQSN